MPLEEPTFERQLAANRRLEDALACRYPMFTRHVPSTNVWDDWGLQVGPGWIPLLVEFADTATALCASVRIEQVKEKLYALRLYCQITPSDGTDDRLYDLIDQLEERSLRICEVCGDLDPKHQHRHSGHAYIDHCNAAFKALKHG